jgi:hypothetical protein
MVKRPRYNTVIVVVANDVPKTQKKQKSPGPDSLVPPPALATRLVANPSDLLAGSSF